jgi:outer membrane protein assembly factor BamB
MKKVSISRGLFLPVLIVVTLSLFWACGGSEEPPRSTELPVEQEQDVEVAPEPEPEDQEGTAVQEVELEKIAIPEIDHAMVTFVTGDAYITDTDDPDGVIADIGSQLGPGQQLEVETGYVELQIGDIGTVRVTEHSQIQLEEIVLSSQGSSVDIRVASGSILNKVERLAGNESYEVRTETAVMGVRGTQFGVNVSADGGTRLAVREGRVSAVPPAADPERVRRRAAETGEAADAVEAIATTLRESAPIIEANQEISFSRAAAEEVDVAAAEMETAIVEIETRVAAGERVDAGEVSPRLNTIALQTAEQVRAVTERLRLNVSETSRTQLAEIDEIRYVPIPPRPSEQSDSSPEPVLVPVRVQVEPEGAQILLDGRPVARERFSGVFSPGEQLRFELTLDGYQSQTLDLTVDSEKGRAFQVRLVPETPQPETEDPEPETPETVNLDVSVEPDTAQLFLDGDPVGRGQVATPVEAGRTVTVRAALDGYEPEERRIEITPDVTPLRFDLEQMVGTVAISVEPADAQIRIDGESVGTGAARRDYPVGTQLVVEMDLATYAPLRVPVTVQEELTSLSYTLSRDVGQLSITATPNTARILINGAEIGTGRVTQELPAGQRATVSVVQDGYVAQERTVQVSTGTTPLRFSLERKTVQLAVTVQPGDARITVDGRNVGAGTVSHSVFAGETVTVRAARPGYAPTERSVQVGSDGRNLELRLEPRPIEEIIMAAPSAWVRGLVSDGSTAYGADGAGTVYAIDPAGRLLWQQRTGNSGNENSVPVVSGGRVAFSGAAELVVLSARDGRVMGRRSLEGPESHLFGRRVTPRPGGWYLPTDDAVVLLDTDGTPMGRTIALPGGSKMSFATVGERLVTADQQGAVLIVDADSGSVTTTISTGMTQPVALAPAVAGNTAYLVGRRGTAVAVDVTAGTVLWETTVPGGRGSFVDPVVAGDVVYVLDRNDLYALSRADGSVLYSIENAAGMPAVIGGSAYTPLESGVLQAVQVSSGRVGRSLNLPGPAAGGVAVVGRRLAVGLRDGRVVIVHPEGM